MKQTPVVETSDMLRASAFRNFNAAAAAQWLSFSIATSFSDTGPRFRWPRNRTPLN